MTHEKPYGTEGEGVGGVGRGWKVTPVDDMLKSTNIHVGSSRP